MANVMHIQMKPVRMMFSKQTKKNMYAIDFTLNSIIINVQTKPTTSQINGGQTHANNTISATQMPNLTHIGTSAVERTAEIAFCKFITTINITWCLHFCQWIWYYIS